MNALIFANGDIDDGEMVRRAIDYAANALVVAADGGARVAEYYGLHVDAVIGDMDSLEQHELDRLRQAGTAVFQHPPEKDETDLELALVWAAEQGAGQSRIAWLRVIGATGGRLDQTLSNVYLLALPALAGCDIQLVAGKQAIWLAREGVTEVHGAAGDTLSLIPLNGTVRGVTTQNLYYPLRNEDLYFGPARGVSNVLTAARASVTVREGVLLLIHTIGRA